MRQKGENEMDHKLIDLMAVVSAKAVNDMLVTLAAGVLAGNEGMTPDGAARIATETLEKLLAVTMAKDDSDGEGN